ncbi:gap junction delta-3 protein-like [Pristis pectinata]|uniref:gap junction delta-3 protein-like n=1 Tax=Pristis pectinata TaxID=685728 RepID=UPI00223E71CC|nr:gap junction delta-3 protein-like [Pristis pectinata]
MGEWNFLSDWLDSIKNHAPMLGRIWLLLMMIFRILVLATVGSDIFEDEQEEFACNTLQPGCKQVCYSKAFPISPFRFWVFHIVFLSVPSLLFVVYAVHLSSKDEEKQEKIGLIQGQEVNGVPRIQQCYIVHVILRLLAEVALVVSQYLIFGLSIEPQFLCTGFPCPHTVDCFVSRPMEKTVFLVFYFAVSILSAIISLVELVHILKKIFYRQQLKTFEQQNRSNSDYEKGRDPHSVQLLDKMVMVNLSSNHSDIDSTRKTKSLGSSNSGRSSQSSAKKPPLNI